MPIQKRFAYIRLLIGSFAIFLLLSSRVSASLVQGVLTLKIVGLGVRHGTPKNVDFGGIPVASSEDQYLSGRFDSEFRIEDLLGSITGHYTTIQCDGVYGSLGNMLTGVYLKAGNADPTLLLGRPGNVRIGSSLQEYTSIISPVTYIYKPTDPANAGLGNKYGDIPRLRILIPANTPPGTYSGTIVFSFYYY